MMRAIDRNFKSVFVAHAGSGIKSLKEIRGKTFAFGSKSSTSGHLMPRHFLQKQHQLDPAKDFKGTPVFSGAHDATAKMVESGKVAAGVLNFEVWKRMLRKKQVDPTKLKVLWITPGYVDYVWTARAAVPKALRKRFAAAFLQLDPKRPKDREILQLQGAKRFVAAAKTDFDAIEQVARSTGLLK